MKKILFLFAFIFLYSLGYGQTFNNSVLFNKNVIFKGKTIASNDSIRFTDSGDTLTIGVRNGYGYITCYTCDSIFIYPPISGGGGGSGGIDDVLAVGQALTADRTIDGNTNAWSLNLEGINQLGIGAITPVNSIVAYSNGDVIFNVAGASSFVISDSTLSLLASGAIEMTSSNDTIRIAKNTTDHYTIPATQGSIGQVLKMTGTHTATWANDSTGSGSSQWTNGTANSIYYNSDGKVGIGKQPVHTFDVADSTTGNIILSADIDSANFRVITGSSEIYSQSSFMALQNTFAGTASSIALDGSGTYYNDAVLTPQSTGAIVVFHDVAHTKSVLARDSNDVVVKCQLDSLGHVFIFDSLIVGGDITARQIEGTNVDGKYRIDYYLETSTIESTNAPLAALSVGYTSKLGATKFLTAQNVDITADDNTQQAVEVSVGKSGLGTTSLIYHNSNSGANYITIDVQNAGTAYTDGTYDVHVVITRIY